MTTLNQPEQATTYPTSSAEKRLKIASYVLIAVGIVDLIRGFMHTFNIQYAATNIAQVDLTSAMAGDFSCRDEFIWHVELFDRGICDFDRLKGERSWCQ